MRDLLILFALIFTLPMIFRRPYVGVVLWAWLSFISPEDYLYGFMQGAPLAKVVSGLTLFCMVISREKKNYYADKFTIAAIIFAILSISSCIFSDMTLIDPWDLCQRVLKILVFCFVMQVLIRNQMRVHAVLIAISLGLGFHGALEGMKFLVTAGSYHTPGIGAFGDNNSFALAIDMVIPILMYLARHSVQRIFKIGLTVVAGLSTFAVMSSFSRGGFIGLLIVGAGVVLSGQNKIRNGIYVGLMTAALLYAAPDTWYNRVDTIETADQDASFLGRVVAWKISTLAALDNPFLGVGFHSVQDGGIWRKYSLHFDTLSFVPTDEPSEIPHAAHSIYFEVLGDLGFTGLILFGSILTLSFVNIGRIKRLARSYEGLEWAGNLASALRVSLLAYAVAGAALSMAYFELFFIIAAILSLVRRMIEHDLVPASRVKLAESPPPALRVRPLVGTPARTGAV